MPAAAAFSGLHLEFLKAALASYTASTIGQDWESFLVQTTRQMHKRFPATLGDKEEPTKEWLENVDDDAPDREVPLPEQGSEEYETAVKAVRELGVKKKALMMVTVLT